MTLRFAKSVVQFYNFPKNPCENSNCLNYHSFTWGLPNTRSFEYGKTTFKTPLPQNLYFSPSGIQEITSNRGRYLRVMFPICDHTIVFFPCPKSTLNISYHHNYYSSTCSVPKMKPFSEEKVGPLVFTNLSSYL